MRSDSRVSGPAWLPPTPTQDGQGNTGLGVGVLTSSSAWKDIGNAGSRAHPRPAESETGANSVTCIVARPPELSEPLGCVRTSGPGLVCRSRRAELSFPAAVQKLVKEPGPAGVPFARGVLLVRAGR